MTIIDLLVLSGVPALAYANWSMAERTVPERSLLSRAERLLVFSCTLIYALVVQQSGSAVTRWVPLGIALGLSGVGALLVVVALLGKRQPTA